MSASGITEQTQHLTFKLNDEVFAFDISKVREVLDFTTVTRDPRMPDFLRGVINHTGPDLRGVRQDGFAGYIVAESNGFGFCRDLLPDPFGGESSGSEVLQNIR